MQKRVSWTRKHSTVNNAAERTGNHPPNQDLVASTEDIQKLVAMGFDKVVDHRFFTSQSNPALHQATASPVYRSSSDEECADMDWNSLGFSLVPIDFIYTMKCSTEVNFIKGQLCRYGI